MIKLIIIRFRFGDIRNNQGLCKCYQPQPSASVNKTLTLIIPDIRRTSSNNFLLVSLGFSYQFASSATERK